MRTVVSINFAYIEAKGKTFYASHPFVEIPLSNDIFISDTLESMRQNVQIGITRRDEQQIEQTLQTIASLVQLYLGIDYSSPWATKSHAYLAAHHLVSAVEAVVPHGMADVLLEGQRLMGRSAQHFIAYGSDADIEFLSEKIAVVACTGCGKEDYRPVMVEGMTQLAKVTFDLLCSERRVKHFSFERLRRHVTSVSTLFLNVVDTSAKSIHSSCLGPYYSLLSGIHLKKLVNGVYEKQKDDTHAQTVIRNIEQWSDGLFHTTKEVLLAAIKAKSGFASDMIYWITNVTEILLAASDAPACDRQSQKKLRKHARSMIATLDWIPDDEESVSFVESWELTEALFGAAMDARKWGCHEISKEIGQCLLSWTFKGGKYETGWGVLERGLCACAVYALIEEGGGVDVLKNNIRAYIQGGGAPDAEVLESTARNIREQADRLAECEFESSRIDLAMSESDHRIFALLLDEIADMLSPSSN